MERYRRLWCGWSRRNTNREESPRGGVDAFQLGTAGERNGGEGPGLGVATFRKEGGSSAVCGACQEEGWGSGWHQTRERDEGGGLSVKKGIGGGCMGRCGDHGSVQGKERENALGPKKTVQFSNYLNIFKMTRIDLIKRWSS
jgi:hypothetical protein